MLYIFIYFKNRWNEEETKSEISRIKSEYTARLFTSHKSNKQEFDKDMMYKEHLSYQRSYNTH